VEGELREMPWKESSGRCLQRPRHRRERMLVRAAAPAQRRRARTWIRMSSWSPLMRSTPPPSLPRRRRGRWSRTDRDRDSMHRTEMIRSVGLAWCV
jgi:hypothetical protein